MVSRRIQIGIVLCLGVAASAKSQSEAQLGNTAFEKGHYTEAVTHFQKSLSEEPTFAVYVNLGHAYMRLQQWPNAISSYEAAIALDAPSTTADVWLFLGQARYQAKQYEEAMDAFLEAVWSDGKCGARLWIARCLIEMEQWFRAKTVLLAHLGTFPKDAEALELLAHVLGQMDDWSGVIDVYRELVATVPDQTTFRIALAHALALNGQNKEAIDALELAWRIDSGATKQVNRLLADLYLLEQMPYEASLCYARVIRQMDQPETDDFFRLATAYFQAEEFASAADALNTMHDRDPTDTRADLYLGQIALTTNHLEEAARHFTASLRKDPNSTEAVVALAQIEMEQRQYEEAAMHYGQAIRMGDGRSQVHYNRILALLHLPNNAGEAKSALRNALAQHPSNPQLQALLDRYVRQRSLDREGASQ